MNKDAAYVLYLALNIFCSTWVFYSLWVLIHQYNWVSMKNKFIWHAIVFVTGFVVSLRLLWIAKYQEHEVNEENDNKSEDDK